MKRILFFLLILPMLSNASTLVSPQKQVQSLRTAQPIDEKELHIIDIGIFYTKDLLSTLSHEQLTAHIERQINAANVVMENSELTIRRRVSYIGEYPIDNQPNMAINDYLATVFTARADQVLELAQQFGFDYITILRPHSDANYCGWAYYDSPYALMEVGGNCTSATLGAHEWGHNDGADHDIANSSDTPLTDYGRGYNCGDNGTIMSTYHNWFTRHDFYSTPNKEINGEACGEESTANVVRMLNEFKDVAGHLGNRQDPQQILASVKINNSSEITINEGNQASIELILVDSSGIQIALDRDASIEIFSQSNSATADSDFATLVERVLFKAGESSKTIIATTLVDSIAESAESFSISLRHGDVIVPAENSITITIAENVGEVNYQFSVANLSIQQGQNATLEITRTGDLSKASEAKLSHQLSWLVINNDIIRFAVDQSTLSVNLSINQLTITSSGDVILSSLDDSKTYDTIKVNGVIQTHEKSSGGTFFKLLLLVFIVKFFSLLSFDIKKAKPFYFWV